MLPFRSIASRNHGPGNTSAATTTAASIVPALINVAANNTH
jgi:hypothetical protein